MPQSIRNNNHATSAWHEVRTKKDLPKKSGDILIVSDVGCLNVGYWDSDKRKMFVYAIRNRWDAEKGKSVLDGKYEMYELPWKTERGMYVAWCEIPPMPASWK